MKFYSFHHKATGLFHPQTFGTDDAAMGLVERNTPPDHIAIAGIHDRFSKCVDLQTGKVIDYQPPAPSADHEWNDAAKRWQLTAAVQARNAARATALSQIAALEASGVRAMREAQLGQPGAAARLAALDAEIVLARADL